MSKTDQFKKHPDECNHPEEQIEKVTDVEAGSRPRCSICGFNFVVIGSHERVMMQGEYIKETDFKCLSCDQTAKSLPQMILKACTSEKEN